MDELSPVGPTDVVEVDAGGTRRYRLDPRELFGDIRFDAAELAGAGPRENADLILAVLEGRLEGAARASVLLNTAAALYVAGRTEDLRAGIALAERTITEGRGTAALERLRVATARVGYPPLP